MSVVQPSYCDKRCLLTIDHTKVSENGTYALLFDGSGNNSVLGTRLPDDVFTNCQWDGGDICFATGSDGTGRLNVNLVSIDTSAKKAKIYVAVTVSTSSDTSLYVFYKSNAGTLTQPSVSASYGRQSVYSSVGNMAAAWELTTQTKPVWTTPTGGTATASSYYSALPPSQSFDFATYTFNNGWLTNGTQTGWLQYQLASGVALSSYRIFPWYGDTANRNPTAWTFKGSNDGSNWTTLDTRTGQTSWTNGTANEYSFSNSTSYTYYRLDVSANQGNTYMGCAELQFLSSELGSNQQQIYIDPSDATGNGNTLTNNGVAVASGRCMSAGSFSGSTDFSTTSFTASFRTLSVWVKPSSQAGYPMIFTTPGFEFASSNNSNDHPYGYTGQLLSWSDTLGTTSWKYLAFTVDASSGAVAYMNGTAGGTQASITALSGSGTTRIGSRTQNFYYSGLMDSVRIGTTVRSANYIATDYAIQSSTSLVTVGTPESSTTAPTFAGTGAGTCAKATAAGSGSFTVPTYTGSGSPTCRKATAVGVGNFAPPTYLSFSAAGTVRRATAAGSGAFTAPTSGGSGSAVAGKATAAGSGSFSPPTYTGTGTCSARKSTASGAGTFTAPTYTGSGSASARKATAGGSGSFTAPVYSGSGACSANKATVAGSGSFSPPTYTGTGTCSARKATNAGSGSFSVPTYTGSGQVAARRPTASGGGLFVMFGYAGAGSSVCNRSTAAGSGSFSVPTYTGSGAATAHKGTASGAASFTAPIMLASGIAVVRQPRCAGAGFSSLSTAKGPFRVDAGRVFVGGAKAAHAYSPGTVAAHSHIPGCVAAQIGPPSS